MMRAILTAAEQEKEELLLREHGGLLVSFHFGHRIYALQSDGVWKYLDNDLPTKQCPPRKCPTCHQFPTKEGHDPCIANLSGVTHACCGHGKQEGYVRFESGHVLHFSWLRIEHVK